MNLRSIVLRVHRWSGLTVAGFLIVAGLTGSLLAFYSKLDHWVAPQFCVPVRPGAAKLDAGTLAERAQALVPDAIVTEVYLREEDRAEASVTARPDAPGKPSHPLDYDQLLLDPYTGAELGRRTWGDITQGWHNLMPFIYRVHYQLAMGNVGLWILGGVALVWTLNCFVGLALTLPVPVRRAGSDAPTTAGFWSRWRPTWCFKRGSSVWRFSFDLHRMTGLWLWPLLLVFAWSAVYMNMWDTVYTWATRSVMEFHAPWTDLTAPPKPAPEPPLRWPEAYAMGQRLMNAQAQQHGFTVEHLVTLRYDVAHAAYLYRVRSSLDFQTQRGHTDLYFDGQSGAIKLLTLPKGQYAGNTVTNWLDALHMANVFGRPYQWIVCLLGLAVTALSSTGVIIWWRKWRGRRAVTATTAQPLSPS